MSGNEWFGLVIWLITLFWLIDANAYTAVAIMICFGLYKQRDG